MDKRIGLGAVAVIAAVVAINKGRILSVLRGKAPAHIGSGSAPAAPASPPEAPAQPREMSLPAERKAHATSIAGERDETPAPEPPAGDLEKVTYDGPLGTYVAYVTPVKPGARRPAIVWIHGGFSWGIDEGAWTPGSRDNDQSALGFRKAGIAEMYPALRGANQNPGHPECFYGEVDDVVAAAEFLAKRPDVDPQRVYIGGHSTGGVMALLAAASTPRFRAVFSFGPVADPRQYGQNNCARGTESDSETLPRAPIQHLFEIVTPTFIIDGSNGNAGVFPMMQKRIGRAPITFLTIAGANHFNTLAPGIDVVAKAILADTGATPAIHLTADAIQAAIRGN